MCISCYNIKILSKPKKSALFQTLFIVLEKPWTVTDQVEMCEKSMKLICQHNWKIFYCHFLSIKVSHTYLLNLIIELRQEGNLDFKLVVCHFLPLKKCILSEVNIPKKETWKWLSVGGKNFSSPPSLRTNLDQFQVDFSRKKGSQNKIFDKYNGLLSL